MNPLRKQKQKKAFPSIPVNWRRPLLIAVATVFGVAGLAYAGIWTANWVKRHPSPPAAEAKPVDIAKFVASDSFDKLRLNEQEAYLEKLRPAPGTDPRTAMKDIDESTRRTLFEKMRDVRDARMKKTAHEYFALPQEQREAWMANYVAEQDKRWAEMRERFKQMRQQRGANQTGGPQGGGPGGPPPP